MGISLTDHRALEIITAIKQEMGSSGTELNAEEFERGLEYI